jgi:hypothetical protein
MPSAAPSSAAFSNEGAQQEAFRRERTRIWMARHIRHREPDIEDSDVLSSVSRSLQTVSESALAFPWLERNPVRDRGVSSSPRRIREGAQQEAFRRERTRIWMARHIRHREPDIEDCQL